MTAKAKKREMVEGIAEKFLLLPESDKSFIAGYLTGKEEERARWQQVRGCALSETAGRSALFL